MWLELDDLEDALDGDFNVARHFKKSVLPEWYYAVRTDDNVAYAKVYTAGHMDNHPWVEGKDVSCALVLAVLDQKMTEMELAG